MAGGGDIELVVFADDWGRHPSSAQHLVRHLLHEHPTLWVNTVGTRRPRLTAGDVKRVAGKVGGWIGRAKPQAEALANLRVMSPGMYPGFRSGWQRRLNVRLLTRAVNRAVRSPAYTCGAPRRVAVTTLPIIADLVGPGKIDVDRWVYYCVDDFSVWPGLDSAVMQAMERELVAKVDAVVCVSEVLRERVRGLGKDAELLTHGVDVQLWTSLRSDPKYSPLANLTPKPSGPTFVFWGLIDERLDMQWCYALTYAAQDELGMLVLAGPSAGLMHLPQIFRPGPVAHERLPALAAEARVLVMPYIDAPVTRAMQPLKLLEYLATYKPVVVRDLPATRAWADCCDVVSTAEDFVRVCLERAKTGLPAEQRAARERRLPGESWSEKARRFEAVLFNSAG